MPVVLRSLAVAAQAPAWIKDNVHRHAKLGLEQAPKPVLSRILPRNSSGGKSTVTTSASSAGFFHPRSMTLLIRTHHRAWDVELEQSRSPACSATSSIAPIIEAMNIANTKSPPHRALGQFNRRGTARAATSVEAIVDRQARLPLQQHLSLVEQPGVEPGFRRRSLMSWKPAQFSVTARSSSVAPVDEFEDATRAGDVEQLRACRRCSRNCPGGGCRPCSSPPGRSLTGTHLDIAAPTSRNSSGAGDPSAVTAWSLLAGAPHASLMA